MSDETVEIPLPAFEQDRYLDRGYVLITEFQDEKRRRDRAAAVRMARKHPGYLCLMTAENRLLHRNVYNREELHLFRELHQLIATWVSPRFFVMGYPIAAQDLLQGLECYEKMGATCNRFLDGKEAKVGSYFGCPRASISTSYLHPKAWYRVFYGPNGKGFKRVDLLPKEDWPTWAGDPEELFETSRQYCGCPLVHVRRLRHRFESLPESLMPGDERWTMAPDMMSETTLQPRSKRIYFELLKSLELSELPCSDALDGKDEEKVEEEEPERESRRERLKRFSWLLDE